MIEFMIEFLYFVMGFTALFMLAGCILINWEKYFG